jgi:hypothetical protein
VSRGWTRSLYCAADTPNFALALVGKDAGRWIVQCVDFAGRDEALAHAGIRPQSFADLLVNHAPPAVAARFRSWGVADYCRILSRLSGSMPCFPTRRISARFRLNSWKNTTLTPVACSSAIAA